jgi:3-oxoadipate enol-lactonase
MSPIAGADGAARHLLHQSCARTGSDGGWRAALRHGAISDGARIDYSIAGAATAPTLLFINSIATTRELWARQVPRCSKTFRVITYDARGHGFSQVTVGDYTIEQIGRDALAILDHAGVESAHICGISLGGLTAMWLGVHAQRRVKSLVLANTAARVGSVEMWTERIAFVRQQGMSTLADVTMPRWFTEGFRAREPQTVEQFRDMVARCSKEGYLSCCAALRDEDLRDSISAIRCPVLCIAGNADPATPPEALRFIHEHIPGSNMALLDAAHLTNVEQDQAFTNAVMDFIPSPSR